MAKRKLRKAVCAGSFDPVTNGHLFVIKQGAKLFDELVLAVGVNPDKTYTFTVEERVAMLEAVSKGLKNVTVEAMPNAYLVNYANDIGAEWVLRGIRDDDDFRYEHTMHHVNKDICAKITSVYLMAPRDLSEVSSSFVRGLVGPAGWEQVVSKYLPKEVIEIIRGRLPGNS
jgi:pantetheine-phosphate adenylyltransferase